MDNTTRQVFYGHANTKVVTSEIGVNVYPAETPHDSRNHIVTSVCIIRAAFSMLYNNMNIEDSHYISDRLLLLIDAISLHIFLHANIWMFGFLLQ